MNLDVLSAWYNFIDNTIYAANCANVCWTLRKTFPIFRMWIYASIFFSLQLVIIFFNYFVTIFSIFVK
jgi:hypothetical protein